MPEVKFMNSAEFNQVQELEILRPCRVKEEGSKTARACKKGEIVKLSGNDKLQLLFTGMAKLRPEEKASK